jgi:hypothetical protein
MLTSSKIIVEAQREVGPAAAKIAYDGPGQITVSIHFSALRICALDFEKH